MYISSTPDTDYEKQLMNLVYIESMLYGSYKRYFGLFQDFYNEELDSKSRKKLSSHNDFSDAFISLIGQVSITSICDKTVLRERLTKYSAKELNEELFEYFKSIPFSSKFDTLRAIEDYKKAVQIETD